MRALPFSCNPPDYLALTIILTRKVLNIPTATTNGSVPIDNGGAWHHKVMKMVWMRVAA